MALCSNVPFGPHIQWCLWWRTLWIWWNSQRQLPHLDGCLQSVVATEIELPILPRNSLAGRDQGAVTSNVQQSLVCLLWLHRRTPFPSAQGFSLHSMYIQMNMELENTMKICPLKLSLKSHSFFLFFSWKDFKISIKSLMKNSGSFITKYTNTHFVCIHLHVGGLLFEHQLHISVSYCSPNIFFLFLSTSVLLMFL